MDKAEFLISGGGIAGLAAAIAVSPRDTILLEQTREWTNTGAGLQLGPNAVRALKNLGAWDAVEPITSSPPEIHVHDGVSGKRLARWQLGASFEKKFGAPYRVAHRADLHHALLEVASTRPNLKIHLAQSASSFGQTETEVSITTATGTFQGEKMLAADGVNSPIRQKLFANAQPRSSGKTYHRALLPNATSVPNIDTASVNLWLYPDGHVVHYPVGKDQLLNIVAITPEKDEPKIFFAKASSALRKVLALPQNWTKWPSLYVEPLPRTNDNRILLIGDAAHGTVPYLAQGSAMALEDAAELRLSPNDFSALSAKRAARTLRLHVASMKQGRIYHTSGIAKKVSQLVLQNLPETLAWSRLSWLYNG